MGIQEAQKLESLMVPRRLEAAQKFNLPMPSGNREIVGSVDGRVIYKVEPGRAVDLLDSDDVCEIHNWTDERERKEIERFLRPNGDPCTPERLFVRVRRGSSSAAFALAAMAEDCLNQLHSAAEQTSGFRGTDGCAQIAAYELSRVVVKACSKMNQLAKRHPRIFHRMSRWCLQWPVMKSTYAEFGDDEPALLRGLWLGHDKPHRLDASAQWARWINDDVGRFAHSLLMYVWSARSENNRIGFDYGHFTKLADALRPLDKHSAPKWWKVAEAALIYTYPNPLHVPELAALVAGRKKRRYPSVLAQAIFAKLKARFISFAKLRQSYSS